ncbi:hypothetical protein Pan241w_08310 [Gimesia alba]|uniref:DUF1499 domain-containing protein n=1 Tax=Gimesia alba TaxID=2527973 RepID=A0A517RA53_9PLAN|nr:DUF1499 domain-containing protein [Gimesia alba]QDT40772.1 hypothetical protein Pan241w_08310 [Gimesia alba]
MILFWCVSFLLAAYLGIVLWNTLSSPPANLGVVDQHLSPCPDSPNCVCSQDQSPAHQIAPLQYSGPKNEAVQQLTEILNRQRGCRIVVQNEDYLRAEFRSLCFRFVDDVEFLVDSRQNVIHVRSASRVGYSDLGANRKRIEAIRKMFANSND